jgi:enoyl-[acyl-carrier protein] reductase I
VFSYFFYSCSLSLNAGPLRSRAAKAIGFIDMMIDYSSANAPLPKELSAGK